jgi:hypothetical protein
MKRKILSALLVMALAISIFGFTIPVKAYAGTNLYSDPASKTLGPPPTSYQYNIMLENATKVVTIAFDLHFNPAYVNVTNLQPGGCLPGGILMIGERKPGEINGITYGVLMANYDVLIGTAIVVTVETIDFPPTTGAVIDICNMNCWDSEMNNFLVGDSPYDHTVYIPKPLPYSPTADFTWHPLHPKTDEEIEFDATSSSSGFDGKVTCPIDTYTWDFDDGNVTVTTDPVIYHTYTAEATYSVNLTVYAPPGPDPDLTYDPYHWTINDVMVSIPPTGRYIDLYTQDTRHPDYPTGYTGEGVLGGQVDSYAPQDLVMLYAKVTYNLEPVAKKLVAFEIRGPTNPYMNISVYRTAFTDDEGIASTTFRIPWPDVDPEEIVFGVWTVLAKVDIAEESVSDTHWFNVDWTIKITKVKLLDVMNTEQTHFKELESVCINTTIFNTALTPRNVTIAIVIYDELGVPIGTAVTTYPNVPHGVTELDRIPVLVCITIPEWAYVGWGSVFVNAYTKLPWDGGICYCNEYQVLIDIQSGS